MTLTVEDVATCNSWGYVSTGRCGVCRTYQELYVISVIKDSNEMCVNCLMSHLRELYRYQETLTEEALYTIRDSRPRPDTDEVCYSCEGVSDGTRDLIATWIGEGEERYVHDNSDCSRSCDRCDTQYPRYNWRISTFYASPLFFPQFEKIFGEECCPKCQEEIYADHGGKDNLFLCTLCDSYEVVDDAAYFNGSHYCDHCYNDNVTSCDDCDQLYWADDGHYCPMEDEEGSHLINSYSYKPRPYFFGTATYHMGFELEVESDGNSRRDGAEVVTNALGERIYLKEDGSLSDGFEIVTHPHSLDEYQRNFDWSALSQLRRLGFRSWDTSTCGLHVHVSRTAFGTPNTRRDIVRIQAHELRFMKLIYDNERQISRLAGRTSSYATFEDKGRLVSKIKHGTQHNGRYSAINSENSATLEVRVFRGSLKPERVLMALELVQCAVEYTRGLHVSASNKALSWMMFTRYVVDNASMYPHLFAAMEKSFMSDSVNES
jgi:hypothetical protein